MGIKAGVWGQGLRPSSQPLRSVRKVALSRAARRAPAQALWHSLQVNKTRPCLCSARFLCVLVLEVITGLSGSPSSASQPCQPSKGRFPRLEAAFLPDLRLAQRVSGKLLGCLGGARLLSTESPVLGLHPVLVVPNFGISHRELCR